MPLLVTRWGVAGYGEWVTLTALASYITYANVGVPGAVRADLALSYGLGGHERMRQSFQSCMLLITGTGALFTAAFLALVNLAPLGWITRGHFLAPSDAASSPASWLSRSPMSLVVGVFSAVLSAVGRYGYAGFVESNRQSGGVHRPGRHGGGHADEPGVGLHDLSRRHGRCSSGVLIGVVQRDVPWVLAGPWGFHRAAMRRLFKPMLGVLATSFGYYSLSFQAPRVILGLVAGPTAVAVYAVTAMLMRVVRMPIDIIAHSPTVELSLAHGAGEPERARAILGATMRTCLWIAICLIPFVVLFGPFVVDVWTLIGCTSPSPCWPSPPSPPRCSPSPCRLRRR